MPLSRRQIYRRRRITVFGGLALVLLTAFYLPFSLLAPVSAARVTRTDVAAPTSAAASLAWPAYGASAIGAVGYDGVLGSAGSTDPLPMASISKVITALVVLEAKPLGVGESGPTITTTQADVDLYRHYLALNGALATVRVGLQLSELQLLQLALVKSANNYVGTLVNWAFGSQDAFLPVARKWLTDHRLTGTTIVEPTGIDPKNVSTATDLVRLGELAIANPLVAQLVSTTKIDIPGVGEFENSNALLGVDGVTGLKTGTLDTAGANLLFSAAKTYGDSTVTVIGVVLGGKDHPTIDRDIQALLDGVYAGFHEVQLTTAGTRYGTATTPWGQTSDIVAATTASVLVWSDTPISVRESISPISTGVAGADVGDLDITVGDRDYTVDLALRSALVDPGPGWRLTHPFGR
ncbi:D-alanyl-D-alanine carboxypeptidase [Galbitalea sp. SE-J8]|uniref:D-alanyl-D-alanine carboxypeptidase family protein n=1 Tax=Galbitalea sp. SE-J8 TaxID=3054952 RepID=UPI00259D0A51|nr:D-alanyl-D-alanine carboxypeptidase [Galbitalea sp. SE-J8]MDM4763152.1 D-alanyl-D-alanine carboxypeptidase [Galbitalea sp. SE-J8]